MKAINLRKKTPELGEEYKEVTKRCKQLVLQMLDNCLDMSEVRILMEETTGHRKYFDPFWYDGSDMFEDPRYPRLQLAMLLKQKEFVSHMYCQQLLVKSWYRGVPWRDSTLLFKVLLSFKYKQIPIICC